jgi:hypothetical protein
MLSPEELAPFGTFDLVYAWGSLHPHRRDVGCDAETSPGWWRPEARSSSPSTMSTRRRRVWRVIKRTYNQRPGVCENPDGCRFRRSSFSSPKPLSRAATHSRRSAA